MTWTTYNPGLIVFLIDQSGSMKNSITSGMSRSVLLVQIIDSILDDLIAFCQRGVDIRNKFKCIIIGYSDNAEVCYKNDAISIERDLCNGVAILKAKESGFTNMEDAFKKAASEIKAWKVVQQGKGFSIPSPRVINITDGLPEMKGIPICEAMKKTAYAARELMEIQADDGNVILSNILINSTLDLRQQTDDNESNIGYKDFWSRISSETNDYLMNVASYEASFLLNSQLFLCTEDRDCIFKFVSLLIAECFHCCVVPPDC